MSALPQYEYTLEEYLELDRHADARLEYWNGEVFDMSGVSESHADIELNIVEKLRPRLSRKGCRLFPANMRIKTPSMPPYRYGDLSALCGEARFEKIGGVDVLTNPTLIIEVLSASTEAYDRGYKFTHYKSIPGFTEYLLIAQDRMYVSHYIRQEGGWWGQRDDYGPDSVITLTSIGCELSLQEIYENITLDSPSIPLTQNQ